MQKSTQTKRKTNAYKKTKVILVVVPTTVALSSGPLSSVAYAQTTSAMNAIHANIVETEETTQTTEGTTVQEQNETEYNTPAEETYVEDPSGDVTDNKEEDSTQNEEPSTTDTTISDATVKEIVEAPLLQKTIKALGISTRAVNDSTLNISQVSDTSSDSARTKTYNTAYFNQYASGNESDPAGGNYFVVAPDAQNANGYVTAPMTVSATTDWSVSGYFSPDRLTSNGATNGGDFIGFNMYPSDAATAVSNSRSYGGGGLGIAGTANAYSVNFDQIQNGTYGDPQPGPFGAFRWTDSSGSLAWMGNRSNLYTNSTTTKYNDLTQWSLPVKYTVKYFYNSGQPYMTGTLDDGYGRTWSFSTQSTGGDSLSIVMPASGYFQLAIVAANGDNHQRWRGSYDSFTGQLASSTNTVVYKLEGTNTEIAPQTTIKGAVGESVGIRGASTNVGSDTYSYNGNVPNNVQSQYASGYHAVRTYSFTNSASDLTFIKGTTGNFEIYYGPDVQQAQVKTDSTDPTGAQTVETLTGKTAAAMSGWTKTDSNLARSGYKYTVKAPNGTSYATLAAAQAAVTTYDATSNGTATTDSTPQVFTVTYAASYQEANVKTDGTDPNGAQTIDTITGVTGATMSGWTKTDSNLARTGYGYTVKGPDGATYATLAAAQAAVKTYDNTANGTATTDSVPQNFIVTYTKSYQQAKVITDTSDPSGSQTVETISGVSGGTMSWSKKDSDLTRSGYGYTVVGPDNKTYTTLALAQAAVSTFDSTNNGSASSDGTPQIFTVSYVKSMQQAKVVTDSSDPNGAQTLEAISGTSGGTMSWTQTDSALVRAGYGYTVKGPDGGTYTTLAAAQAAVKTYDNTNNPVGATTDSSPQTFTVTYTKSYQEANVKTDGTDPKGAQTLDTIKGVSGGTMSGWTTKDTDVARAGYIYTVKAPNGQTYTTLSDAQAAVSTFDNTANGNATSDSNPQIFTITYVKSIQQAKVVSDSSDPNGAQTLDTITGETGGTMSGWTIKDEDLVRAGYGYSVTGPDGQIYPTLSDAQAAVNVYDTTTNPSNAQSDSNPQTFTVKYTKSYQEARVVTDSSDPNGVTTVDVISGVSGGVMSGWKKTDQDLSRPGYSYIVTGPDGTTYATLAAAQARVTTYDNTANGNKSTDSSPQIFTVTYSHLFQQATVKSVLNGDTGTTSTIATYDTTTTPVKPLQDGTTGNLKADVTDSALAKTGYTYTVTGPDNKTYATMQEAWEANNAWDTTNNPAGSTVDSDPQVWTVNYTGVNQIAVLDKTSSDGSVEDGNITSVTGPSGSKIDFAKTDADLQIQGYSYTITVSNSGGTIGTYNSLKDALAANSTFDATNNGTSTVDADPQKFLITYIPTNQVVTYHYLDTNGNEIKQQTQTAKETGTAIDTSNPPAIDGYTFKAVDKAKSDDDMLVNENGTSAVYYVYDIASTIKDAAQTAIDKAKASDVSNETSVQDAIKNLEDTIKSPIATPQQIQDATDALNNTVTAEEAKRQTAIDNATAAQTNTSPVSNEAGTAADKQAVNTILNDPTATTQQIQQATDALVAQTESDKSVRESAINSANTLINNAKKDPQDNADPGVQQAIKDLQDVMDEAAKDSSTALTQQIIDAEKKLNEAMISSDTNYETARNNAETLLTQTSPLSNEPDVAKAITELNEALNSATAATSDLQAASDALQKALNEAKPIRETANTNAAESITAAKETTVINEPAVQQAIENLESVVNKAAADSKDAVSSDITAAQIALDDAVKAAKEARETALKNAETAKTNAEQSAVKNETSVINAEKNLENVLADPDATTKQITDATDALNKARSDATAARNEANTNADEAIKDATPYQKDADVAKAIDELNKVKNDPASTTQQIIDATNALNSATASSQLDKADATATANDAMKPENTAPVSNEQSVADAKQALQDLINSATSTGDEIRDATTALNTAVANAKEARNDAITSADNATSVATSSPVSEEPGVAKAINDLNTLIENSKKDDATALTKDIEAATQALQDAQKEAQDARTAANTAISTANGSKVNNEDSIKNAVNDLQTILNNPASTTDQIKQATDALNQAVADETAARDKANADAATATKTADDSKVANEQTVKDAQTALDNVLNNANSTTKEISDATDALNQAVTDATAARDKAKEDAATATKTADDSTVANEQTVKDAQTALDTVLKNENSTTQEITNATDALNKAVADETAARDKANADAATATKTADDSTVANEQTVKDAQTALDTVLKNENSTTQEITNATDALNKAVADETAARDKANADAATAKTDAGNSEVANEQTVKDAQTALDTVLKNENSTTQEISDATDALNKAVEEETTARDKAKTAAETAISEANSSSVGNEQEVKDKTNNLQQIVNNPTATTQEISDATDALNQAVADETAARETAVDNANKAKDAADTSPVANEQSVKDAQESLNNVVKDKNSTTEQIKAATDNLNQIVEEENTARETAENEAKKAIDDAKPVASDSKVTDAKDKLQEVVNNPTSTTQDIKNATDELEAATVSAQADRDKAVQDATQAMDPSKTAPVSNEAAVAQAITNLDTLVKSTDATTKQIQDAITALESAVKKATDERNDAISSADALISNTTASAVGKEPSVVAAINNLTDVIANSKKDDPNALTQTIKSAMDELQKAKDAAQKVRDDAQSAIDSANDTEVDNEQPVINAITNLENVLNDPTASNQDIQNATDALNKAVTDQMIARDEAQANADNSIGRTTPVSDSSDVDKAKDNLEDVLNDPTATTQDIKNATDQLNEAITEAQGDRNQVINDANTALSPTNTAPVSHETAVATAMDNVRNAINNPNATAQQIKDATTALQTAVKKATDDRNSTIDSANKLINDTNVSAVGKEPGVEAAINNLNTIIENSKQDDASSLTQDIKDAMNALQKAKDAAQKARDEAQTAINNANGTSVSNNTKVTDATNHLQDVLNDPTSSIQQIKDATNDLNDAIQNATNTTDGEIIPTGDSTNLLGILGSLAISALTLVFIKRRRRKERSK